jgi:hypothetical protein
MYLYCTCQTCRVERGTGKRNLFTCSNSKKGKREMGEGRRVKGRWRNSEREIQEGLERGGGRVRGRYEKDERGTGEG